MIYYLIFSFFLFHTATDNLKKAPCIFSSENISSKFNEFNDSKFFSNNSTNLLSLKLQDDYICNGNGQMLTIKDQTFQSATKIANEGDCTSISIIKCTFNNIAIPETSQPNGQMSIIYIKSIDFSLTDSSFSNCNSKSKIPRPSSSTNSRFLSLANFPISDHVICHAIYLDENIDHEVKIENCEFSDNGNSPEADGTIIYSSNVDNLQISYTTFKSNTIFTRAIETYYTKNIELNYNSFTKMKGPKGQNGGGLLVQFANNVNLKDCIFDSNTLQPNDETAPISDVVGSAFFINLNGTLTFTNNTITNHEKFLNSVITFNKNELASKLSLDTEPSNDNLPIKRKVSICDSKFIQNSYSQTSDGNGIGVYIEDYAESLPDTNDGEVYILSIEFSYCSFKDNGNSDCTASIIEWSRQTSFISFSDCNFDSNTAKSGSNMFNILSGSSFLVEFCEFGKINGNSFLHFTPLTTQEKNPAIKLIEISITSPSFENSDAQNAIGSNFILTEGDSLYTSSLNVINCSFIKFFTNNNNYIIKSNSNNLQVNECNFEYPQKPGSRAITSTLINATIDINNCNFQNCPSVIVISQLAEKTTIKNCSFLNCLTGSGVPVIDAQTKYYFAENCDIKFTTSSDFFGMQLNQAMNAEILSCNFKYTKRPAIRCDYDLANSILSIESCTITTTKTQGTNSIYSKNAQINLINTSITNEVFREGGFGLVAEMNGQLLVDRCKFFQCHNYGKNAARAAAITVLQTNKLYDIESYMISNCEFTKCTNDRSIAFINSNNELPQFINNVIAPSEPCLYFFVIYIQKTSISPKCGACLFQNVSFLNTVNTADAGGGIGLWLELMGSIVADYALAFNNCYFKNTHWNGKNAASTSYGGGAISVESSKLRNYHISISYCSFYNTKSNEKHGGAIAVISSKSISLNDCYIEGCSVTSNYDNDGGAIYVNQLGAKFDFYVFNVTVNGSSSDSLIAGLFYTSARGGKYSLRSCNFINCNKITQAHSSVVRARQNNLEFECINTKFIFDKIANTNSRGIDVHSPVFKFKDCYFRCCGRNNINFGGGIYYDDSLNVNYDETIEISDCTFEQCLSANTAGIRLTIYNGLPSLYNNTFIDIEAKYILALMFEVNVQFSHILLGKQRFIRCTNLQTDGGGSGIWVSNHRADGNVYPTYIDFSECDFIENRAPSCGGGGAYGIGDSSSVRPTQINFEYCNFIGNECTAGFGGGAIWIRTSIPSFVSSCVFKNNRAGTSTSNSFNGGAIYIMFTSSVPHFYLSDSTFINNSCVNSSSNGHAIYAISLFASLTIDNCEFYDNGVKENPDSVIHTSSYLKIYDSTFAFTDKSQSSSRAMYVGSSSELSIYDSTFVNFTDPKKIAGAIYYQVSMSIDPQYIEISYCTFDSNTEGTESCEMKFEIIDPPDIYGCTFKNENTLSDLIIVYFEESIEEMQAFYYYEISGVNFVNCNLNNNFFFNFVDLNNHHLFFTDFSLPNWNVDSCSDFYLVRNKFEFFTISQGTFINNENENILFHFSVNGSIRIDRCEFNSNRIRFDENKVNLNETGIIFIENATRCIIYGTDFINENVEENGFVIRSNTSLELDEVSIINCTLNSYSILMIVDESIETTKTYSLKIAGCTINESGSIYFENRIDEILVSESTISNSINGLMYNVNSSKASQFTDLFQITQTTFDNLTNSALYAYIFNEITLTNNTIKNCQKLDENNSPIFELDLRSNTTDHIIFEQVTFENNRFNNENNRLMNGGGIGLFITFPGSEEIGELEITIDFVECNFISNKATQYGGAYSFVEESDGLVVLNTTICVTFSFEGCTFSGNSCNKFKGHALYIESSNTSIENCVFDSHSLIDQSEDSTDSDGEISLSSVVFITLSNNESISLSNCSFINNKASSLYIVDCDDEITITNCNFESNDIIPINSTISSQSMSLISSSVITIVGAKEMIQIDGCTFMNNSEAKTNNNDNKDSEIIRSSTIFVSTESSFTMSNTNFFSNNINDLILNAILDVSVINCQFIDLENTSSSISVRGGALIINTKKKVQLTDCSFGGYSSSFLEIEGKMTVLSPVQIISDDLIQITNITVAGVYGDVFRIKSNTSITVSNCVFDSNSTDLESSGKSDNVDDSARDFLMTCCCEKDISMDSVSIANYKKAFRFTKEESGDDLPNTRSMKDVEVPSLEGTSLKIENFTFTHIQNALSVIAPCGQISIEKSTFSECTNNYDGEKLSNDPIVSLTVFACTDSVRISLNSVRFENNEFTQNSEKESEVGGGSGLSILSDETALKKFVTVEFNSCEFFSNRAQGNQNSGGALHFTSHNEQLTYDSLKFQSCLFSDNEADCNSGSLHLCPFNCSSLTVTGCEFTCNKAGCDSGAVFISPSNCLDVSVFQSIFVLNEAQKNTGALFVSCFSRILSIDLCIFVNNSARQIERRTDSLYVTAFSETRIERCNFSKAVLMDEDCGCQFSLDNCISSTQKHLVVSDCLFCSVNPSSPQLIITSKFSGSNTTVYNSSFTHFFIATNKSLHQLAQPNSSSPFYHVLTDSSTRTNIIDCCFDTARPYALSSAFGVKEDATDGEPKVVFVDSVFSGNSCAFPEIVNELIAAIVDDSDDGKDAERERDRKRKLLIIGLSTGAAALVVILVIVIVIVVYKKKHKEMKQTIEYDDDCQEKLEQEEFEFINSKYNQNEEIVPVKVNNLESWYQSERECEETEVESFDI